MAILEPIAMILLFSIIIVPFSITSSPFMVMILAFVIAILPSGLSDLSLSCKSIPIVSGRLTLSFAPPRKANEFFISFEK